MSLIEVISDRISGRAPKGAKRSPDWRIVRSQYLELYPQCAVCGSKKNLTVHHKIPFYIAPDLELEFRNLITLCSGSKFGRLNCHLVFGHLGNYRKWNTTVDADSRYWRFRLGQDPNI